MVQITRLVRFSGLHFLPNPWIFLEPVYRLAEKEWVAFVDAWVTTLVEVDDQIPPLPPKDIIHRIYRDVSHFRLC